MNSQEHVELPEFDAAEDYRVAQLIESPAAKKAFDDYHLRRRDIGKHRGSMLSMSAENSALLQLANDLFAVPLVDLQHRESGQESFEDGVSGALFLREHEAFYRKLALPDAHPEDSPLTHAANENHEDAYIVMFSNAATNLQNNIEQLGRNAQKKPINEEEVRKNISAVRSSIDFFQSALNWHNGKVVASVSFMDKANAQLDDSPVDNAAVDRARTAVGSLQPSMELVIHQILPEMNERIEMLKANINQYAQDFAKGRNNIDLLMGRNHGGNDGNVTDLWKR